MIFSHLGKFHEQTISLSEDISKRIIQHFPTNAVVEKKRNGKSLEWKTLKDINKNEFCLSFLMAFISRTQNNIEKIAQGFPEKKKKKIKKH